MGYSKRGLEITGIATIDLEMIQYRI